MKTLLTAAAVLASAGIASAGLPVLITVDNTDPNNIVFAATGAASAVDASASSGAGFTLQGLFAGAGVDVTFGLGGSSISGTLQANGMTASYVNSLNAFGSLTDNDLNIWGGSGTQNWTTVDAAFSGSSSTDILASASFNSSGLILLGDNPGSQPAVLGTWQLIPTPGTAGLLGLAGLAAVRRRR